MGAGQSKAADFRNGGIGCQPMETKGKDRNPLSRPILNELLGQRVSWTTGQNGTENPVLTRCQLTYQPVGRLRVYSAAALDSSCTDSSESAPPPPISMNPRPVLSLRRRRWW